MFESQIIAHYHSCFTSKFGIPKQSGLVESLEGTIIFTPEFRNDDFIRGIDGFDYLWLIWEFSDNKHRHVNPTVRPPVLGGNQKMGVFATRSPYRPNPFGLSSVRLLGVEHTSNHGIILKVAGGDLLDGTPIFDIKPYLEYTDSHRGVRCGFIDDVKTQRLQVVVPSQLTENIDSETLNTIKQLLALDPRPHYQHDANRIYGMNYMKLNIRFLVEDNVVRIVSIDKTHY